MKNNIHRQRFFDKQVKMEVWKNSMAGKNEEKILAVLENLGYVLGKDFYRQYPIEPFVLDFAFPHLRFCIEVDDKSHNTKIQTKKDIDRDCYLKLNKWDILRIKDKHLFGEKGSFYKSLIKIIVEDLTELYNSGRIFEVDLSKYYYARD